jgi:hypothetical protein
MRSTARFGCFAAAGILLLGLSACSGNAGTSSLPAPTMACGTTGHPMFLVETYSDAAHRQERCAFNLGTNAAAYVQTQNVAPSDSYVMSVQTSGAHPSCVYVSPPGRTNSRGGSDGLCDVATAHVTGVHAPGGNVSLSWAFNPSLQAGSYTVAIYDQTIGIVLGSTQVNITR